jgi:hypothetical protein
MDDLAVMPKANNAKDNNPNQDGNKAAPRPGANLGMVNHVKVDMIDHGKHESEAKRAMADLGHENCVYFDGGMR